MNTEEYQRFDATALAELVSQGEITAQELQALAQQRYEQINPTINAVLEWFEKPDQASAPDGPFCGVPFLIKDLVCHTSHSDIEMGSRLAQGVRIPYDTDLMKRFRGAGLHTMGRTTTPEFGYCATTESILSGPTRNPWDLSRSSGGSSGGAAAAVAAGIVPIAHANDGGGSIRIPAACCGLVGLKPSRGRVSAGPDSHDPLNGLGIEFAVSKSVRDSARLLDAVHGEAPGDGYVIKLPEQRYSKVIESAPRSLHIALNTTTYRNTPINSDVAAATERVAALCESLGHRVMIAKPQFNYDDFIEATHIIWTAFVAHAVTGIAHLTGRTPDETNLEATTLTCYREGLNWTAQDLLHALDVNNMISRQVAEFFSHYDMLLTPTLSELPLPLGELNANNPDISAREWTHQVFNYGAFTGLFNTTGQPAISLPLARTAQNLPIGIQFAGRMCDEATLLQLAAQLEMATPWPTLAPLQP